MSFLRCAIFGALFGLTSLLAASESRDLEILRTVDGREFHGIFILEADHHGLSFRHEKGIAKLPFSSLPASLRRHYAGDYEVADHEVAERVPDTTGEEEKTAVVPGEDSDREEEWAEGEVCLPSPVVVSARSRIRVPSPVLSLGGGYCPARQAWPRWEGRYHRVHELTNPYSRELAVRDFLYCSGLLAVPRGIRVTTVYR